MNSALLLLVVLALFALAYRGYGWFLNRLFQINNQNQTPACKKFDGVDFVPAKNWLMLFGHHFSSICGAGPIVGPVLAAAYWGWLPSLFWLVPGVILMGAVADFSSLVLSVRSEGRGISEIAKAEISPTARLLFSLFIWLSLILIIAVFAIFGAKTFVEEASSVTPSVGLIPLAILTGLLLYKTRLPSLVPTVLGLGLLLLLLWLGNEYPIRLSGIDPMTTWVLLLLFYCLFASVLPVQILLQPRDYLASYLLLFTILIGAASVFVSHPTMNPSSFVSWYPKEEWPASGPLFPMLFVTIACGAISGFHSLVSSGTTCKQIALESHCKRIGYGGMLMEGLVAVLVLIAIGATLSHQELTTLLRSGGPIAAFGTGFGNLTDFFLGDYGKHFAILALNAFILTSLDSATRIARYLTTDLFRIRNKTLATLLVLLVAGLLAVTGKWTRIWPAFGTANQLIAGLALLVAACWLVRRRRPSWPALLPALFMLAMTTSAFVWQISYSLRLPRPDYFISAVAVILIVLSLVVFSESTRVLLKRKG